MERLTLKSKGFPDGCIELVPDQLPVILGRSRTCDITINDELLSRQHSEIAIDDLGRLRIRDLGSTNLTIVNERDVETHELVDGDVILLGETQIDVELVAAPRDPNDQTTRDLTMLPNPNDETIGN